MPQITVGELIEKLSTHPPDLLVLVDGYEDGYDDPIISEHMVVLLKHHEEWEGPYAAYKKGGGPVAAYSNAIVLGRNKSGG